MRWLGLLAAVAPLAGCISDQAQSQSPAVAPAAAETPDLAALKVEQMATMRVFIICLMRNARDLDDRRSEPGSIATGAMSACGKEFDSTVEAHSRYLPEGLAGREKVAHATKETSYAAAVQFVLKHRNGTLIVPR